MAYRSLERGTTLLEIMLVFVVIAVLVALSWAALSPSKHNYDPRQEANLIAGTIRAARMRALSTGSCHAVYLRAGSQDWAKTYVTVPAGGWMVAQGNIPYCTTDGSNMKFGDQNILDYSGAAPWDDPHGQLIGSSFTIPKAVGSGQKDQSTWVSIFGLNCCTKEDEVDGGVPGYTGSCNAPNDSLFSKLGQSNANIVFLFYPDGRIRLLDAINGSNHLYSGTAGLTLCTPTAQRFTVYMGTTKTFNNNLSKSTAGSEKDFADLQYSITIDGNTGRVRVQKGW